MASLYFFNTNYLLGDLFFKCLCRVFDEIPHQQGNEEQDNNVHVNGDQLGSNINNGESINNGSHISGDNSNLSNLFGSESVLSSFVTALMAASQGM